LIHAVAPALLLFGGGRVPAVATGPAWVVCSPTGLQLSGRAKKRSAHPIAEALQEARPGTVVWVKQGDYPPLRIGFDNNAPDNARTSGGRPGAPIVVEGRGRVRILGTGGDAISISQAVPNGYITFRNIEIRPGERSGVHFFKLSGGKKHEGYHFENCDIIADFDHRTGRGSKSKWGVWGHSLSDFAFVGVGRPARVENIRFEHGFYLQNPQGSIRIERVHARRLGRTFLQLTSRRSDGPPGIGDVIVRNCLVEDVGLSVRDGYKGGSAFTVAGGLRGRLLFEHNTYRAGFDRSLLRLTRPGQPYGTGAFVAWRSWKDAPNGELILRDNDFAFAPGCGDRPVVSIGGCQRVDLVGANRFVSGGTFDALALDPVQDGGKLQSSANGKVSVSKRTRIEGRVTLRGDPREPSELGH